MGSKKKRQVSRKTKPTQSRGGYFGPPLLLLIVCIITIGGVVWVKLITECQDLERAIQKCEKSHRSLRDKYVRENAAWNKMKSRDNVLAKLSEWNIVMGEPCYDQIIQLPMDGSPTRTRSSDTVSVSYINR